MAFSLFPSGDDVVIVISLNGYSKQKKARVHSLIPSASRALHCTGLPNDPTGNPVCCKNSFNSRVTNDSQKLVSSLRSAASAGDSTAHPPVSMVYYMDATSIDKRRAVS